MASRLTVCRACRRYSLKGHCTVCAKPTDTPHPARFSPEDTYGEYRRRLKRLERKGRA